MFSFLAHLFGLIWPSEDSDPRDTESDIECDDEDDGTVVQVRVVE